MATPTSQTHTLGWTRDRVIPLVLAIVTIAAYIPGIQWGLPQGTPGRNEPWGPDEIAAMGPLYAVHGLLTGSDNIPTKYPLLHYLIVAIFYVPYLGLQILGGRLANPGPGYPYGFTDPVAALRALTLIARSVSLLMAAGTVVAAYFTAKTLWNRRTAVLAAVFALLMYPMFYYGKVSNVDVPALFWTSLVLLLAARVLREGWTTSRAVWMAGFAALAIATKDQSYATLILLPVALVPFHLRAVRDRVGSWSQWKAPLIGLLVAIVVYLPASGLAIRPQAFARHYQFISTAWVRTFPSLWYYRYSDDLAGYLGLLAESSSQIIESLGWPLFATACAGIVLCAMRERAKLVFLLVIPILFVGVIFPVRHTAIRFMLPVGYVLALYAARALAFGLEHPRRALRSLGLIVLFVGCGFELAKAADLAYLMRNDPRDGASVWLERYSRPGDRLEFFENVRGDLRGRINKMPYLPAHVEVLDAAQTLLPGSRRLDGDFVLTVGPEDQELHWFCPAIAYRGLHDGSLGYQLGASFQQRALFAHTHLDHHINPRVELFVRRDRAQQLGLSTAATATP